MENKNYYGHENVLRLELYKFLGYDDIAKVLHCNRLTAAEYKDVLALYMINIHFLSSFSGSSTNVTVHEFSDKNELPADIHG